ncbi:hypothetical protein QCA50_004080 [Cerrena zonata]|uniref:Matrin-type domain-containing protein n=1 Tax=Cerrena zonata TaxID=2478898 RepID=A0AAW0GT93_9APHY
MSEYWVSHKKYFCKYCNIYIADDAPSRRQHETGLRHTGNVERFVRGLYKTGEKRKQDQEEEKREMARVERAAQAAYAQDVSSGLAKPGSSSTQAAPKPTAPSKPAPKSTDPYANYSTAESLGIEDPDAERAQAEAERRQKEGVAGEWEFVPVETTPPAEETEHATPAFAVPEAGQKRRAPPPADEGDVRHFRLKKKKLDVGLGELYDPGIIPIKLKTKKEEPKDEDSPLTTPSVKVDGASSSTSSATPLPKWSARGWKKPGEVDDAKHDTPTETKDLVKADVSEPVSEVQDEGLDSTEPHVPSEDVKPSVKVEEPETSTPPPSSGGLFRKRKLPAGGSGSRGRRF